jgi:hypothetical protein
MRSHRPYDAGWSSERVYARMKQLSGTAYDPVLLDRFFRIVAVRAHPVVGSLRRQAGIFADGVDSRLHPARNVSRFKRPAGTRSIASRPSRQADGDRVEPVLTGVMGGA